MNTTAASWERNSNRAPEHRDADKRQMTRIYPAKKESENRVCAEALKYGESTAGDHRSRVNRRKRRINDESKTRPSASDYQLVERYDVPFLP
jgi:hypothetical protein